MDQTDGKSLKERLREAVGEMDVPLSAFFDLPRIELSGDAGVLIECHQGIIEYSDTVIQVAAKDMILSFTGKNLELRAMNKNEMSIKGIIQKVELKRTGAGEKRA